MSPPVTLDRFDHFDRLYRQSEDPWQVHDSWYEQRKQALMLACLPRARYRHAFEPACGTGALTAALAGRCDTVLAADGSGPAVEIARKNTAHLPRVQVQRLTLPGEWPTGRSFDLIVLSEWLYYLPSEHLLQTVQRCFQSLAEGGTLIACHWRHPFDDRLQATDDIHAALQTGAGLASVVRHEEHDFLMEAWTA